MLKTLAALGIGIITTVAGTAAAHDGHGGHGRPGAAHHPGYRNAPAPVQVAPRGAGAGWTLRQADYNRDGGVSMREAHRFARTRFERADHDRNGVLTGRELRQNSGDFARGPRGRDGAVTQAEYNGSIRNRFRGLDQNNDGFLSRYELDRRGGVRNASYDWRW